MTAVDSVVSIPPEAVTWLRDGATLVPGDDALFRVDGPGVVECVQGVLTNDVVRPGPGSVVYGAMLTPKGMIVVDLWVLRDSDGMILVVPTQGREPSIGLFQRQLPPRLARVEELTPEWSGLWVLGGQTETVLRDAGLLALPPEGHAHTIEQDGRSVTLAAAPASAPWRALILGPKADIETLFTALEKAGARAGTKEHLEAARILAGWPALGREIGEKTLPQEVRYDELSGVSYTKGCYVGQETVARVHFRGHPNRHLRGLLWEVERVEPGEPIFDGGKEVGRVGSVLEIGSRRFGLAVLRREVEVGSPVTVGRVAAAQVSELPFQLE